MPAFRKSGLSYYNPQMNEWSTRYIPLEAAVKDSCRLLLYVITDDTRGVTSMLEVRTRASTHSTHFTSICCVEYRHCVV